MYAVVETADGSDVVVRVTRVFRFCRPTEIDALQPNVTFSLHFSYFLKRKRPKRTTNIFWRRKDWAIQ